MTSPAVADALPEKGLKKLPPETLTLQFAGDMVLIKRPDAKYSRLMARYQSLFEHLANLERSERILIYRMLNGLMLTAHARKSAVRDQKKHLFDLKNQIFISLAQNAAAKKLLEFRYLVTPRVYVKNFCEECRLHNESEGLKHHKAKHCSKCDVDPNFFNILCMQARFPQGNVRLFLSHDRASELFDLSTFKKSNLQRTTEEAQFRNYHYGTQNLDAISVESALKMHEKFSMQ